MTDTGYIDFEIACTKLASEQQYVPILKSIFSQERGKWLKLNKLLHREQWQSTETDYNSSSVIWLPHPEGEIGYAFVLVRNNETGWSTTFTYNLNSIKA